MHAVRFLLFLLLVLPSAAQAARGTPWSEPFADAEDVAEAAAKVERYRDEAYVVLHDEARFTVDDEGRVTQEWRLVYRIESDAGLEYADSVEVTWHPWYQEQPEVRARVVLPSGEVAELDPSTLNEFRPESDGSIYSDLRGLEGPLPRLEVGAVVERVYITREHRPFFSAGAVYEYSLAWAGPALAREVELVHPADRPVQVLGLGLGKALKSRKSKGQVIWHASLGFSKEAPDSPTFLPRDAQPGPALLFSTGSSWGEVAAAYSARVDEQLAGEDLSELAETAMGDATDPREQVDRALAFVHDRVRYTGLELGENSQIPVSPSTTLERGYGDCKDQSTLLVGLLRARGIDASVALLRAGSWFDVRPELPGLRAFDHAIVYVNDLDLWIDPTDSYAAAGELRPGSEGRLSLVARPGVEELVLTPRRSADDNYVDWSSRSSTRSMR